MSGAFLKSLVFGVFVAASIGPIALWIFATAVHRGLRSGSLAGLGAALADLIYALLAFSIGALLLPPLAAQVGAIRIGAALVLVALAVVMIHRELAASEHPAALPRRPTGSVWPTFLLTLINPLTLVLFAGFVPQLPIAGSLITDGWLAFGLFCGSLAVQLAIAVAGWLCGAVLPGRGWQRTVNLASAAGILAFGLAGLRSAV